MPDKLEELQRLFLIEAARYRVLPLDDRRVERVSAALAGRPTLIQGNTQLLFAGMGRLSEHSVIDIKNRSHSVTAQVVIPDGGASGVIIAQGGAFGGWTVYLLDGKPAYCYNLFGAQLFKVVGESAVDAGEHQIRVEFDYDGGGYGKGGNATLFVDGDSVGEVRVDATVPMIFSLDETTDLGQDTATAVTDDLTVKETEFTGRIRWVQIDVGDDAEDADHYISADERFRIAMAIQ
jgi:arylsulfatase